MKNMRYIQNNTFFSRKNYGCLYFDTDYLYFETLGKNAYILVFRITVILSTKNQWLQTRMFAMKCEYQRIPICLFLNENLVEFVWQSNIQEIHS